MRQREEEMRTTNGTFSYYFGKLLKNLHYRYGFRYFTVINNFIFLSAVLQYPDNDS